MGVSFRELRGTGLFGGGVLQGLTDADYFEGIEVELSVVS